MYCTRCGQQNPGDSRFCARCGTALVPVEESAQPDEAAATTTMQFGVAEEHGDSGLDVEATSPADVPDGGALLVVRRGPNAGSRFVLDEGTTAAGRSEDGAILLDDVTVSRRHAEFIRTGDQVVVRDVGSLNGTYVNRNRIEQAELSSGDEVQIGRFRLLFLDRATSQVGDN